MNQAQPLPQAQISAEDRQVIHYISGSIIRAFLRKARQYKSSCIWTSIKDAIIHCILEGEVVVAASNSDRMWTEYLSRGVLCFVGAKFLDFIVSLDIICVVKKPDGSIYHQDFQEQLFRSKSHKLWDDLISSRLSEDQSLSFMIAVVKSFTSTYGWSISKTCQ